MLSLEEKTKFLDQFDAVSTEHASNEDVKDPNTIDCFKQLKVNFM